MNEVSIELSDETLDGCESRIKQTEFENVEEYISFIIQEVVSGNEFKSGEESSVSSETTDQLESLGYL